MDALGGGVHAYTAITNSAVLTSSSVSCSSASASASFERSAACVRRSAAIRRFSLDVSQFAVSTSKSFAKFALLASTRAATSNPPTDGGGGASGGLSEGSGFATPRGAIAGCRGGAERRARPEQERHGARARVGDGGGAVSGPEPRGPRGRFGVFETSDGRPGATALRTKTAGWYPSFSYYSVNY